MRSRVVGATLAVIFRTGAPTGADRQLPGADANWPSRPGAALAMRPLSGRRTSIVDSRGGNEANLSRLNCVQIAASNLSNPVRIGAKKYEFDSYVN